MAEYPATRHLRALSELVPLHIEYLESTRPIGHEMRAAVCDAAAVFAALPEPHEDYFQKDGIHLSKAGDTVLAHELPRA